MGRGIVVCWCGYELRFTAPSGSVVLPRADIGELQWIHGLVVIGDEAFLLDPDDQLELLGALDPAWATGALADLPYPPDDLLDELAALDDEAVAAAAGRGPDPAAESAPRTEDRIDRVADAASSPVAEEVAATVGKMPGVNKGTTRSLFRAFRKARR